MMTTYNETSACDYCSHTLVFLTAKKSDRDTSFQKSPTLHFIIGNKVAPNT